MTKRVVTAGAIVGAIIGGTIASYPAWYCYWMIIIICGPVFAVIGGVFGGVFGGTMGSAINLLLFRGDEGWEHLIGCLSLLGLGFLGLIGALIFWYSGLGALIF